jgi:GT2 family glycosyltransferase
MTPTRAPVATVVLTHNRCETLRGTLAAIRAQTTPPEQIIVVDNASTDDTARLFDVPAADLVYVRCDDNLGAAAGRGVGLEHARAAGFDWTWVVDDDTLPAAHALERLRSAVAETPRVGMVGLSGGVVRHGVIKHLNGHAHGTVGTETRDAIPCDFVLLDGALVSMHAVADVGLPRTDLFIMMEDVEYPLRMRRAGWEILLVEEPLVTPGHMGSAAPWRGYYQTRNELLLAREARSPLAIWGWVVRQAKFTAGHVVRSDQKLRRLRYRALGAWHGIRGVRGRTVEPGG